MGLPTPIEREEMYLSNIAGQGTPLPDAPISREEMYLDYIAKNGGGGGTGEGDMKKSVYDSDLDVATAGGIKSYVSGAISDKVDKVSGKGLSTNDYDDTAKGIVDGVTSALDGKVSKSNTAGLLKNDGTVDETHYVSDISGKADKVSSATSGDFAGLDSNGNLTDSRSKASDFATASSVSAILDGTSIDSFSDVESALADKVDVVSGKGLSTNDYDNTAKAVVDTAQDNIIANTKLIKDTVGWSGKNKLKNHASTTTTVETTFTVNSDKSVKINTASATAARRVLMLKTTAQEPVTLPNGRYTIYSLNNNTNIQLVISGYKNGAYVGRLGEANTNPTFDYDNSTYDSFEVGVIIEANKTISNQTIYPMICDADILDDTFEPYFGSTAFPRSEQAVLGAKNFYDIRFSELKEKYWTSGTWSDNIYTVNGGTITVNAENDHVTEFIVNGAFSANTILNTIAVGVNDRKNHVPVDGKYRLNGISGGSSSTYGFILNYFPTIGGSEVGILTMYNGDSVEVTINKSWYLKLYLQFKAGTYTNVSLKPMLRLSTDTDTTFATYAMTNKELTDAVVLKDITSDITRNTEQTAYSVSTLFVYKIGRLITVIGDITSLTENAVPTGRSFTTIATGLPKALKSSNMFTMPIGSGNQTQIFVDGGTGNFKMRGGTNNQTYQFVFTYISES